MKPHVGSCRAIRAVASLCVAAGLLPGAGSAQGGPPAFRTHPVTDTQQGGLVVATIDVPVDWRVDSRVEWRYGDVSLPVRVSLRAQAPDGSAWVEFFPRETFYWLEPVRAPVAVGGRALGMIHLPGVTVEPAIQRFVIDAYRGRMPGLRVVGSQPMDPASLSAAFRLPALTGEARSVRLQYQVEGRPAEEDVYALLAPTQRIPYTGPQGTTYESHRHLLMLHSIGATDGLLAQRYPLLAAIATSVRIDPIWDAHRVRVEQALAAEFNRLMQKGYETIAAAGQISRSISANNDAMLSSMQTQRAVQAQRDAARRVAEQRAAASSGDGFSQAMRGTQRMKDPYWGESERPASESYHWTDGQGSYRSSNDPSFNPNVGAGGGPTWQRMEPTR